MVTLTPAGLPGGSAGWFALLVTGSRGWDDPDRVESALLDAAALCPPGRRLLVVHGRCDPRRRTPAGGLAMVRWDVAAEFPAARRRLLLGADWLADVIARERGWATDPHPADWEAPCRPSCRPGHREVRRDGTPYCPAAGDYRNTAMAELRCPLGAAFIKGGSRGATHCAAEMERHGTKVRRYTAA